jgi:hypothetical protein
LFPPFCLPRRKWRSTSRRPNSQVAFTLGDVLHTVHGTFALKHGQVRFDPEAGSASGEIVVDAASGRSGSPARDRRMHDNILESGRYPEIVFRPDRVEGKIAAEGASDALMHGVFTIHGPRDLRPRSHRGRRRTIPCRRPFHRALCKVGHEESEHVDSPRIGQGSD